MKKEVVIFDFDGTIADILPLLHKYTRPFAEQFHFKSLSNEEIDKLRNHTIQEIIKELKISLINLPFMLLKAKKIFNQEIKNIKLIPGIQKVLEELKKKGYHLGILSSNSQENLNDFLEDHKLNYFDFIHSEFNIFGKAKALKNLLKKYNLNVKDVTYVGDEVRDIEACKREKISIIAVTWGLNTKKILKKYNPDYLVDKPVELLKILT